MKKLFTIAALCSVLQIQTIQIDLSPGDIAKIIMHEEFNKCANTAGQKLQPVIDREKINSLPRESSLRIQDEIEKHIIITCYKKLLRGSKEFREFANNHITQKLTKEEQTIVQPILEALKDL